MSLHEQVITLCAANNRLFLNLAGEGDQAVFSGDMLSWMDEHYPEIGEEIERMKALDDLLTEKIIAAAKEYKDQVMKRYGRSSGN